MQTMKRKKQAPQQFELPVAGEVFNLKQETTPAPTDNEGKVYVLRARYLEDTWVAFGGYKMTRSEAEIAAQHCRQIWKNVSYTIEKTNQ